MAFKVKVGKGREAEAMGNDSSLYSLWRSAIVSGSHGQVMGFWLQVSWSNPASSLSNIGTWAYVKKFMNFSVSVSISVKVE